MAEATPTEIGAAIVQVDDTRLADDPFKLPPSLRSIVAQRLADFLARESSLSLALGDRTTASGNVRAAYDALNILLHDAFNFVDALPSYIISKTDKKALLITYGWAKGLLGEFSDARINTLTQKALTIPAQLPNPDHRLPQALTDRIATQWAIIGANQPLADGGSKEVATGAKNHALELLEVANSRVRFYYCSCSDETQSTKELSKILLQPRREYGSLQNSQPQSPASPPKPPNS